MPYQGGLGSARYPRPCYNTEHPVAVGGVNIDNEPNKRRKTA